MKTTLMSRSTDEMSGSRSSRASQRQDAGPDSPIARSSLADAPRTVAQRKQLEGAFGSAIQRVGIEEEEEPLQGKFETARRNAEHARDSHASNRTGMPAPLKAGIESLSGLSLDAVRVHFGSSQPAQLNALAYAQGSDIHIAPGQEHHLPHEAWHVVQQAQGRVQATMQVNEGVPVNDDAGLEREADVMGAKAANVDPFGSI